MKSPRRWVPASRVDGILDVDPVDGRERGFTLIEVLVVMTLIAAISVLALGAFGGGLDGVRLRAEARAIAAGLRMAQALAVATGQPQEVQVEPAAEAWSGPRGRGRTLPRGMALAFVGAREVQPAEGIGTIRFFPEGGSTGGRVRVQQGTAAWDVDVAWLTGEVRMHRVGTVR